MKTQAEEKGNLVERSIAKLMLNSLYGGFGMNEIIDSLKIVNKEKAEKIIKLYNYSLFSKIDENTYIVKYSTKISDNLQKLLKNTGMDDIEKSLSDLGLTKRKGVQSAVQIAAAITAYGRIAINQFKNDPNNTAIMSATDSLICQKELPKEVVGKSLGQMKLERKIAHGIFIRKNVYGLLLENGEFISKCGGLGKNKLTYSEFQSLLAGNDLIKTRVIFKVDWEYLTVKIIEIPFTIKGIKLEVVSETNKTDGSGTEIIVTPTQKKLKFPEINIIEPSNSETVIIPAQDNLQKVKDLLDKLEDGIFQMKEYENSAKEYENGSPEQNRIYELWRELDQYNFYCMTELERLGRKFPYFTDSPEWAINYFNNLKSEYGTLTDTSALTTSINETVIIPTQDNLQEVKDLLDKLEKGALEMRKLEKIAKGYNKKSSEYMKLHEEWEQLNQENYHIIARLEKLGIGFPYISDAPKWAINYFMEIKSRFSPFFKNTEQEFDIYEKGNPKQKTDKKLIIARSMDHKGVMTTSFLVLNPEIKKHPLEVEFFNAQQEYIWLKMSKNHTPETYRLLKEAKIKMDKAFKKWEATDEYKIQDKAIERHNYLNSLRAQNQNAVKKDKYIETKEFTLKNNKCRKK